MNKKDVLIIIDMQKDFVYGPLAAAGVKDIVPRIEKKMDQYFKAGAQVICTRDTHFDDYLETQEGKKLPVPHCKILTDGWCMVDELYDIRADMINKEDSFGTFAWKKYLNADDDGIIEVCGTCTDICVISNVLILKSMFPQKRIIVDASCCAGTSDERHKAALKVMESCQVDVIYQNDGTDC